MLMDTQPYKLFVDEVVKSMNLTKPAYPRCECGHRKQKHFEKGIPVPCKWHRPDEKTGKEVHCDCIEYWVLEEKLKGV